MENPIKMDDLGGPTPIFGLTPICTIDFNDDLITDSQICCIALLNHRQDHQV